MIDMEEKNRVDHGVVSTSTANSAKHTDISDSSDPEKPSEGSMDVAESAETTDPEFEYITGVKLWLATAAVTLVCFLMMLDMSIIVTVSLHNPLRALDLLMNMTGYPSNHHRLSFARRCGLVWQRVSFIKVNSHISILIIVPQINGYLSCALQPSTGKIYSNFGSKVSSTLDFSLMC
jgi:hypothetical protein